MTNRRTVGGVRLRALSFDQLLHEVRALEGLPEEAAAPLAAVVYRHLPLPRGLQRLWEQSAVALLALQRALAGHTDDARAVDFIDRFFRRFYPGGLPDRLARAGAETISRSAADAQRFGPGAERWPDRTRFIVLGFAVLRRHGGLPAARAAALLAQVLAAFTDADPTDARALGREHARARRSHPALSALPPAECRVLETILASPEDRRLPVAAREPATPAGPHAAHPHRRRDHPRGARDSESDSESAQA
jgi:hypothetical protein